MSLVGFRGEESNNSVINDDVTIWNTTGSKLLNN